MNNPLKNKNFVKLIEKIVIVLIFISFGILAYYYMSEPTEYENKNINVEKSTKYNARTLNTNIPDIEEDEEPNKNNLANQYDKNNSSVQAKEINLELPFEKAKKTTVNNTQEPKPTKRIDRQPRAKKTVRYESSKNRIERIRSRNKKPSPEENINQSVNTLLPKKEEIEKPPQSVNFNEGTISYDDDVSKNKVIEKKTSSKKFHQVFIENKQVIDFQLSNRIGVVVKEPITINGVQIPINTNITAYGTLSQDRLILTFDGLFLNSKRIDISAIELYDLDGVKGIKIKLPKIKGKKAAAKTGKSIAGIITRKTLGNDYVTSTLGNDGSQYAKESISGKYTIEKGRAFFIRIN